MQEIGMGARRHHRGNAIVGRQQARGGRRRLRRVWDGSERSGRSGRPASPCRCPWAQSAGWRGEAGRRRSPHAARQRQRNARSVPSVHAAAAGLPANRPRWRDRPQSPRASSPVESGTGFVTSARISADTTSLSRLPSTMTQRSGNRSAEREKPLSPRFMDHHRVALEAVRALRPMAHTGQPDRDGHVDDDGEIGNGRADGGVDETIHDIGGQPAGGALIDPARIGKAIADDEGATPEGRFDQFGNVIDTGGGEEISFAQTRQEAWPDRTREGREWSRPQASRRARALAPRRGRARSRAAGKALRLRRLAGALASLEGDEPTPGAAHAMLPSSRYPRSI